MKIGPAIIMGSWPTTFARSWPSKISSASQTARLFCDIFFINICSSLRKLNFQLNREEIKRFWSKILSSL